MKKFNPIYANLEFNLTADIRARFELNQDQLAHILDVSVWTIQRWEAKPNEMSTISKLALRSLCEDYQSLLNR